MLHGESFELFSIPKYAEFFVYCKSKVDTWIDTCNKKCTEKKGVECDILCGGPLSTAVVAMHCINKWRILANSPLIFGYTITPGIAKRIASEYLTTQEYESHPELIEL